MSGWDEMDPFRVVDAAVHRFMAEFALEPSELWVGHGLWRLLATAPRFSAAYEPIRKELMGMALLRHDGPLTLIARRRNHVYRWRLGHGFDGAIVTDERAEIGRWTA